MNLDDHDIAVLSATLEAANKKIEEKNHYLTGLSEALCDKPDASFDEMLIAIEDLKSNQAR